MNAATEFTLAARSSNEKEPTLSEPKITYEGQSTFLKFCEDCQAHYPHIRALDYTECAVCGKRTHAVRPVKATGLGRK